MRLALTCLLGAALAACGQPEQAPGTDSAAEISLAIAKSFEQSGRAEMDLRELGPAGWERVCVLGPYTSNKIARETLGFEWDAEKNSDIAHTDGSAVVLFVKAEEVLAFVEQPRDRGDLSSLTRRCFVRQNAVFEYLKTTTGRVLRPSHNK